MLLLFKVHNINKNQLLIVYKIIHFRSSMKIIGTMIITSTVMCCRFLYNYASIYDGPNPADIEYGYKTL